MMKSNKGKSTKESSNLISNIQSLTFKDHRGITLVALIITIIVMLILVGVSITIALKGGLFDTTKKVAKETENAVNIEKQLANGRVKIDGMWYDSIEDYVGGKKSDNQTAPEKPDTSIKPYNDTAKDTNGILTANATYTSDGKTAVIPKGFKIIDGIEGTKSINDGLVIQDKDGNEFVWIPVEVTESDTETNIASFYRSEWKDNARSTSLEDSTEYIEPYASGYTGEEAEYNAMVKSVYTNKGFYIGRYEAGSVTERTNTANGTTEVVVKKNQYPYIYVGWGASMSDYTSDVIDENDNNQGKGAVRLSKEMYQNKDVGVTSTLCYGVQWDAMLDFIKDQRNVTDSGTWGNYKPTNSDGTLKNTGSSDSYSAKNIYDASGNAWEWTMEFWSSRKNRTIRGYDCNFIAGAVAYRTSERSGDFISFRPTLYIK